jgi:ribosomal protein S18 acetylase RimI-like enzyme
VFVPDHTEASGYISCYGIEDEVSQIGLLAIDAPARGQGLGTRLVNAALSWSSTCSYKRIRVVTQGRNNSAVKLYDRCGFERVRREWWYHRWFTEAVAR